MAVFGLASERLVACGITETNKDYSSCRSTLDGDTCGLENSGSVSLKQKLLDIPSGKRSHITMENMKMTFFDGKLPTISTGLFSITNCEITRGDMDTFGNEREVTLYFSCCGWVGHFASFASNYLWHRISIVGAKGQLFYSSCFFPVLE